MKTDDGIAPVIGTAENLRQLAFGHSPADLADLDRSLLQSLSTVLFTGKLKKKPGLFQPCPLFFPTVYNDLER
jgi:hypothetical protein